MEPLRFWNRSTGKGADHTVYGLVEDDRNAGLCWDNLAMQATPLRKLNGWWLMEYDGEVSNLLDTLVVHRSNQGNEYEHSLDGDCNYLGVSAPAGACPVRKQEA